MDEQHRSSTTTRTAGPDAGRRGSGGRTGRAGEASQGAAPGTRQQRVVATAVAATLALGGGTAALCGAGAATVSAQAGNGVTSMSASQALAASLKALKAVPNLRLSGFISEGAARLNLDVESAGHGASSQGSLVSHSSAIGFLGTVAFVTVESSFYIRGGPTFWSKIFASDSSLTAAQRAKVLSLLVEKWIELPASDAKSVESEFGSLTNPSSLASQLTSQTGKLTKSAPKVVDGQQALPIISSKGGTLYIATAGAPLPIELTGPSSGTSGTIVFSYPSHLSIGVPPGAVSLAQIEREAGG